MVIERLEIENFRSLKKIDVNCDELTILIGKNGAGKSSLLYALDFFYDVSAQATPFDYFAGNTDIEIKIRVTFGDLRDDEIEEFRSQLTDGKLIVTKKVNSGGAKYYGVSRQISGFNYVRQIAGARDKTAAFNTLVDSGEYDGLSEKVRSAQAAEEAMSAYEVANPHMLETFESEQQFLGPKNIGGGKLDKFTRFVLIPAVRDAASETTRKGAILQLIDVLVMRSVNKRPDVQELNEEIERRIGEVYNHENLTELGSLAKSISDLLNKYSPGAGLDLSFGNIDPPKITLPPAVASLIEDNFKCPINYTGHGLQRALILTLLQLLSTTDLSPEKKTETTSEERIQEKEETQGYRAPDLILAIEEPELYLHPSRSRYLSSVLHSLSRLPKQADEARSQILLATHSPFFVNIDNFDRVRLARKIPTEDKAPLQCQITEYSRTAAAEKLAKIYNRDPAEFTAESFVARTASIMTSMVNEGFFADAVVVVEGVGDMAILCALQDLLGGNWDANGIVVIPAGGKNNIDRLAVIFEGLGIPTYLIFDGDSRHKGTKNEQKTIGSNEALLALVGAKITGFPNTQAHGRWAVFNDDMETELQCIGHDLFVRIRDEIAEELGYERPSTLLKNSHAAMQFIRQVYELGYSVPILEEIVLNITRMGV